jgi:Sec7-like guanine-nucleotide exchange factor
MGKLVIEVYGEIKDGEIFLPPVQNRYRKRMLAEYKDGTKVKETISKVGKAKTQEQLGAIFGLAFKQIVESFECYGWDSSILLRIERTTGVSINEDMLKQYFYSLYPTYQDDKLIGLSKMTAGQAALFFDRIRNHAASQWSIVIPDPDPEWRKKFNLKGQ